MIRVVIPAKNEESNIRIALDSTRNQVTLEGQILKRHFFEVIVLANNCEDATADAVRDYAARFPEFPLKLLECHFPVDQACIGSARRLLFDYACDRFELIGIDGIVATTDADTIVAPDWIVTTLVEFATGANAVGGRISLSPEGLANLCPDLRSIYLRDTGYRILLANLEALVDPHPYDPYPRHHQHFGASLAVRVSTYRRAGGIPPVITLEDIAFYKELQRIDARVRHSPQVRVTTSGRRDGRVLMGLSTQLEEWAVAAEKGIPRTEEAACRSLKRMELVRERRCVWQRHGPIDGFETAGSYLQAVAGEIEDEVQRAVPYQPVQLEQVIQELRVEVARRSKRSSRYVSSR
jgi:hypothetical protein